MNFLNRIRYINVKIAICSGALLLLLSACGSSTPKTYKLTQITGERIKLDKSFDAEPDDKMYQLVSRYKQELDHDMKQKIGVSQQYMKKGRPESLLTNLTADAMREYVMNHLNTTCDMALVNVQAHRADLPQGDITVRNIYEIYPFDNKMVLLKMKGANLKKVLQASVKKGGLGLSSNVRVAAVGSKIKSSTINNQTIDPSRVYTIVTIDYLADGNSGMSSLKKAQKKTSLDIFLRDMMLEHIKTKTLKGEAIRSQLDGRIIISK